MFSSSPNYTKLKTNLRLAVNRLKLIEKKKTELAQKARKEIADFLAAGKPERARIRVEHIIREDYLVEAMEIVEMYCDLLLARFGLITQMNELDEGIAEPIVSLIWVSPRLQSDVSELKFIAEILTAKYGKPFGEAARAGIGQPVNEKLMHKLAIQAPPKLLVEKYLIEIAKIYNVEYEPDPHVMKEESRPIGLDGMLIDLSDRNNLGGRGGGGGGGMSYPPQPAGFIGYPQPPALPQMSPQPQLTKPFSYPTFGTDNNNSNTGSASAPTFSYNIPPSFDSGEEKDLNINTKFLNKEEINSLPPSYSTVSPDDNVQIRPISQNRPPSYSMTVKNDNLQNLNKPKPQPRAKLPPMNPANDSIFPELPNVPSDLPDLNAGNSGPRNGADDEIDFDDLSRRFEELKKRK